MTQPNQSELFRLASLIGCEPESEERHRQDLPAYIAANYTANTKLKALIEASEKLNLEFHGRPDCKNCSLQEQLAELIKAKEQPDER